MSEIKIGDKCIFYDQKKYIGIVRKIEDDLVLLERLDNSFVSLVHRKQCRKLVNYKECEICEEVVLF